MNDRTAGASVSPLDAAGRVAVDVLCSECGYNLRTLHIQGLCPECGAPVARAADLKPKYARWLGDTAAAVVALGLVATGIPVIAFLCWLLILTNGIAGADDLLLPLGLFGLVLYVFCGIVSFGVTSPAPASHSEAQGAAALITKICLGIVLLGFCCGALAVVTLQHPLAVIFIGFVVLVSFLSWPVALLWCVADLTACCGRRALVKRGRILILLCFICEVALIAVLWVSWIEPDLSSRLIDGLLLKVLSPIALLLMLLSVLYLSASGAALQAYARQLETLTRAARSPRSADANAAAPTAPPPQMREGEQ